MCCSTPSCVASTECSQMPSVAWTAVVRQVSETDGLGGARLCSMQGGKDG